MKFVNFTVFFPWGMILHLTRALLIYNIIHSILKDKYKSIYTFLAIIGTTLVYAFIALNWVNKFSEIITMIIYYLLIFLIVIFLTEGKIFAKIFSIFFSLIVYLIIVLTFECILKIVTHSPDEYSSSFVVPIYYAITLNLFVFASSFIFVALINLIKSNINKRLNYRLKYTWYFIFPISHAVVSMAYYITLQSIDEKYLIVFNNKHPYLLSTVIGIFICCLIFDLLLIFIIDKQAKTEIENNEYEKQIIKNDMDFNQMQLLKEEKLEFRKLKHDMANILVTSKGFIEIEKPEKALELINSATDDLSKISKFSLCSNDTVNTVLSMKINSCKEYGIELNANINENYPALIDDYDLCRLLSNIIDNCINALAPLEGEKSADINIEVSKEKLIIESKNRFSESKMGKHIVNTSSHHGYGTSIIKSIAKKYGGNYNHFVDGNIYITKTEIINKQEKVKETVKA